jgi:mutator protein MutT
MGEPSNVLSTLPADRFVSGMDWTQWAPRERANLCFIIKEGRVLLIRKKRGLGAGKINAPGGKLELGETALEAAVRETQEEVGLTPLNLEDRGLLRFHFTDGYGLVCAVFVARDFVGQPVETDEADPVWVSLDAIPYHEMWADDALWLPTVLAGGTFTGSFLFEGEKMLKQDFRPHGAFHPGRKPKVLVAGCGFTGLATARLFHDAGWEVVACTRSAESAAALGGEVFATVACDISRPEEVERLLGQHHGLDLVIHCAAPGQGGVESYREVYFRGAQVLAGVLAPRQLLFTSSSSVYAQTDGAWVTEHSPAEPSLETGRVLRQTEDWVLAHGGTVARLVGIYGPGRSMLLKKFLSQEAVIEGDGLRWLNLVHRDDIASALLWLAKTRTPGIFNVSDNSPLAQRTLYSGLAETLGGPLPPEGPVDLHRKRGYSNKQVSSRKLHGIGWEPKYASFLEAVKRDPDLLPGARAALAKS